MIRLLWNLFWKERELKRQLMHLLFGLAFTGAFFLGWITPLISFILFGFSVVLSLILRDKRSILDRILLILEREAHFFDVPLRGLIFFMLGASLTITFFDMLPALAGLVVLSVADAFGTLYGKYMGSVKIPWNESKHLEGPVLGALVSMLVCLSFLPFGPALVGSTVGALVDTFPLRIGRFEIDDNLLIPIATAAVVTLML